MVDSSGFVAGISKVYRQRAHQNQPTGITLQSVPTLKEMDDMLEQIARIHMSLQHLRNVISNYHLGSVSEDRHIDGYVQVERP